MRSKIIVLLTISTIACFLSAAEPHLTDDMQKKNILKNSIPADSLKLKITVGKKVLYARFTHSGTTRDFIRQLPLTLDMQDLNGREKYSGLLQELSKEGSISTTFREGDISYWLGGGIAVFYNNDGHEVKAGLITLARLEKGIELFKGPGSVNVKFEVVSK